MTKRLCVTVIFISAFTLVVNAGVTFRTRCLEQLARAMHLELPGKLGPDVNNDSTWTFKGKPLRVCTNSLGDISHIGYKLFNTGWAASYRPAELLYFIERMALEEDVQVPGVNRAEREARRNVMFGAGHAGILKHFSPDDATGIESRGKKGFVVRMQQVQREGQKKQQRVEMAIRTDYQVLSGANAIELENIVERDLPRMSAEPVTAEQVLSDWKKASFSHAEGYSIASKGTFLSNQIRASLYLQGKGSQQCLVMDSKMPLQSLHNLLLTGCSPRPIPLQLTLNKYGYRQHHLKVTLQQFVRYCQAEGCILYLGIKDKDAQTVSCTLWAVNHTLAYSHMLILKVPVNLIAGTPGMLTGTLYTYTPLQSMTDKFFNNSQTSIQ